MKKIKTSFSCFTLGDAAEFCCVLSLCQEETISRSLVSVLQYELVKKNKLIVILVDIL